MTPREVVVVGGSIAALTAVQTLRMEDFDGRITVLSDEDVPPCTRVPLSKGVLAGTEPIAETVLAPLSDEVNLRLGMRATALDIDARLVHTTGGPVRYDGLVIATGGRARRVGRPDQDERVLRSHLDCARLRDEVAAASSVLIIGGGFLGMEMASTCRGLGKQVTLVDLAPPLDRLLGSAVGEYVRSAAAAAGVRIVITHGGVRLLGAPVPAGVETANGQRLEADLVISAAGDVPNIEWLAGSGVRRAESRLQRDGRQERRHQPAHGSPASPRQTPDGAGRRPGATRTARQAGELRDGAAESLADDLVSHGSFDAVHDLARPFVGGIIYHLNGLPEKGREHFFDWASAMFDALGPANARTERGLRAVGEMFQWLATEAGPGQVAPDSWSATIYQAVARGDVPGATAHELLSTYIAPALDTTIYSLAWAIQLFGQHAAQWTEIRENPDLIPGAYREILRLQTPVHHFGRRVEQPTELDGVPLPGGTHVMISYASANRDERRWQDPERFDIHRDNMRQLAFGYGIHSCIGQGLARLEGHAMLAALARRVERFELRASARQ